MKFVIQGFSYSFDGLEKITLNVLREFKPNVGMDLEQFKTLAEGLDAKDLEAQPDTLSDDVLIVVSGMIWLARRSFGEKVTLEQACDFPLTELQIVLDEDEGGEGADPPPAILPDGVQAAKLPRSPSPPTSKLMSAPA